MAVRIEVPATSANLGSGFDALGLALTMYNRVEMEEWDGIDIADVDGRPVPQGEDNLVYTSARYLFAQCGRGLPGLKLRQESPIPMARGLGSSSACIVAGLMGANQLLKSPLNRQDLVNMATKMEGHPDNVAPAILGGLVTSVMEGEQVFSVSVPVSRSIKFVAFVPNFELKTAVARGVLPKQVSHEDAVYNLSRAALMTASLFSGSLNNLRVAVQDKLQQPYRLPLIPDGEKVMGIAYELGAYAVYISGAGPTIMAIIDSNNMDFEHQAFSRLQEQAVYAYHPVTLNTDMQGATVTQ